MSNSLRMLAKYLLILQVAYSGSIWSCQATPIVGDELHHSEPVNVNKGRLRGKALQIEDGWLTLAMPGSSSHSMGKSEKIKDVHKAESLVHSGAKQMPVTSSSTSASVSRDGQWSKLSAASKIRFEAQQLGQKKKLEREAWYKMYPERLPPLRYFSHPDLRSMGLDPTGARYKAACYLEEMKMRKQGLNWPRHEVDKPIITYRLSPLTKTPIIDGIPSQYLIKKQKELNQLFQEDGSLSNSNVNKSLASTLLGKGRKRPRTEEMTTSQDVITSPKKLDHLLQWTQPR